MADQNSIVSSLSLKMHHQLIIIILKMKLIEKRNIIHIHEDPPFMSVKVGYVCVLKRKRKRKEKKRSPCVNGLKMVMGHKGA